MPGGHGDRVTAINKLFDLPTHGKPVDGRNKDNTVGFPEQGIKFLHVILEDAAFCLGLNTAFAGMTGLDMFAGNIDDGDLMPGAARAFRHAGAQLIGVAVFSEAAVNDKHMGHGESSFDYGV